MGLINAVALQHAHRSSSPLAAALRPGRAAHGSSHALAHAQGGPPGLQARSAGRRPLLSAPAKAPVAPARESLQGCACVRGYRVAGGHPPGASRASGAGDAAVVAPHGQSCPPGSGRASHRRLQRPTACSELPSGPERRGLTARVPERLRRRSRARPASPPPPAGPPSNVSSTNTYI